MSVPHAGQELRRGRLLRGVEHLRGRTLLDDHAVLEEHDAVGVTEETELRGALRKSLLAEVLAGAVLTAVAYWLMVRIGRLPEDERVLR